MINFIESSIWICRNTNLGGVECSPYSLLILIPIFLVGFLIGGWGVILLDSIIKRKFVKNTISEGVKK